MGDKILPSVVKRLFETDRHALKSHRDGLRPALSDGIPAPFGLTKLETKTGGYAGVQEALTLVPLGKTP